MMHRSTIANPLTHLRFRRVFLAIGMTALAGLAPAAADYVDHITGAESGGRYDVFNSLGKTEALGRYQFIPSTFAAQGYMTYTGGPTKSWSSYSFNGTAKAAGVSNVSDLRYSDAGHALQDAAFDRFTTRNWSALSSTSKAYLGSTQNGAQITQDGLLSVSHFLGAGGANRWIESGFDASVLPWQVVTANGFSSYAQLQNYLLKRMTNAAGQTWAGGSGEMIATSYGDGGMYDATEGFPGIGTKRPVVIHEVPPFQGTLTNLAGETR